jgi:hypothetical protein
MQFQIRKSYSSPHSEGRKGDSVGRIETTAGHGAGRPGTKQIEEFTDVYSFLFWQLGVKETSLVGGRWSFNTEDGTTEAAHSFLASRRQTGERPVWKL